MQRGQQIIFPVFWKKPVYFQQIAFIKIFRIIFFRGSFPRTYAGDTSKKLARSSTFSSVGCTLPISQSLIIPCLTPSASPKTRWDRFRERRSFLILFLITARTPYSIDAFISLQKKQSEFATLYHNSRLISMLALIT